MSDCLRSRAVELGFVTVGCILLVGCLVIQTLETCGFVEMSALDY